MLQFQLLTIVAFFDKQEFATKNPRGGGDAKYSLLGTWPVVFHGGDFYYDKDTKFDFKVVLKIIPSHPCLSRLLSHG